MAENVIKFAEEKFQQERYYEASQLYIGAAKRFNGSKKYTESIQLLSQGIVQFIQHNQTPIAVELCNLLLDVIQLAALTHTAGLEVLLPILPIFPSDFFINKAVINAILRWSKKCEEKEEGVKEGKGHPKLHYLCALNGWKEKEYQFALPHFVLSDNAAEFTEFLYEWANDQTTATLTANNNNDNNNENGGGGDDSSLLLFDYRTCKGEDRLLYAILLLLAEQNMKEANEIFKRYLQKTNDDPTLPSSSVILQFIHYLLLTLERDASPLFQLLRSRYSFILTSHPTFHYQSCLDTIGEVYYQIPKPNGNSIFSSILKSFFQ